MEKLEFSEFLENHKYDQNKAKTKYSAMEYGWDLAFDYMSKVDNTGAVSKVNTQEETAQKPNKFLKLAHIFAPSAVILVITALLCVMVKVLVLTLTQENVWG